MKLNLDYVSDNSNRKIFHSTEFLIQLQKTAHYRQTRSLNAPMILDNVIKLQCFANPNMKVFGRNLLNLSMLSTAGICYQIHEAEPLAYDGTQAESRNLQLFRP